MLKSILDISKCPNSGNDPVLAAAMRRSAGGRRRRARGRSTETLDRSLLEDTGALLLVAGTPSRPRVMEPAIEGEILLQLIANQEKPLVMLKGRKPFQTNLVIPEGNHTVNDQQYYLIRPIIVWWQNENKVSIILEPRPEEMLDSSTGEIQQMRFGSVPEASKATVYRKSNLYFIDKQTKAITKIDISLIYRKEPREHNLIASETTSAILESKLDEITQLASIYGKDHNLEDFLDFSIPIIIASSLTKEVTLSVSTLQQNFGHQLDPKTERTFKQKIELILEILTAVNFFTTKFSMMKDDYSNDDTYGRPYAHRDLKPGNVLINHGEDGKPIAKLIDAAGYIGDQVWTGGYAAPEIVSSSLAITTEKSDSYSLGVMVMEILTKSKIEYASYIGVQDSTSKLLRFFTERLVLLYPVVYNYTHPHKPPTNAITCYRHGEQFRYTILTKEGERISGEFESELTDGNHIIEALTLKRKLELIEDLEFVDMVIRYIIANNPSCSRCDEQNHTQILQTAGILQAVKIAKAMMNVQVENRPTITQALAKFRGLATEFGYSPTEVEDDEVLIEEQGISPVNASSPEFWNRDIRTEERLARRAAEEADYEEKNSQLDI